MAGYTVTVDVPNRAVACDGCKEVPLDIDASGIHLAPFLRATMGTLGRYALSLRSPWFVPGELTRMTSLGFELGFLERIPATQRP